MNNTVQIGKGSVKKSLWFVLIVTIIVFGGAAFLKLKISNTNAQSAAVSIAIKQPAYGFFSIPSEKTRYYANVTNGSTNGVTWSVKGATITGGPFTSGWIDVTSPATGGTCTYSGKAPNYTASSPVSFTLTATSNDDTTKSSTITINVCNPSVTVNVVPGYRVLYANQQADLQSFVVGSVNKDVTWSIISQPSGGNGTIVDSVNRDTVFSASVKGRYTVQATSVANPAQNATSILYVTGNPMPYTVTANKTEPVDCTVDPNSTGPVYDVGPTRPYPTIASVPWLTLPAGSTVRIHNDDTTGQHPTTYNEYFTIYTKATQTNPVRVVGCADSYGNLPVIDGTNATTNTNPNGALTGDALIMIYKENYLYYGQTNITPAWISIEGLKLTNANDTVNKYLPGSKTPTQWGVVPQVPAGPDGYGAFVSAIRLQNGYNISITGNEISASGLAIMTEAEQPESDMSRWLLIEGNNLHDNVKGKNQGETGGIHTMYLQSFGQVVQGNYSGDADSSAAGGDLKDRGVYSFIRYNTFSAFNDSTTRTIDLVDQQDARGYMDIADYLQAVGPALPDDMPLDNIAAWNEAWHNTFFYGNIVESKVLGPIHFGGDHGIYGQPEVGTLWYWNNTGYDKNFGYDWSWFDPADPNGVPTDLTEFQQIQSYNNIIWQDNTNSSRPPYLNVISNRWSFLTGASNILPSTCCTNNQVQGSDGTGWKPSAGINLFNATPSGAYAGADNEAAHVIGFGSNLSAFPASVATRPFNLGTFAPIGLGAGTVVPAQMADLPVRFQPDPNNAVMVVRTDAGSTIGAVGSGTPSPLLPPPPVNTNNSAKAITVFNFNGLTPAVAGTITGTNIILTVPHGTNVAALVPTITTSGSSIFPNTGIAQNFTNPVTYIVTASDNSTQAYTVTVTVAPLAPNNSAKAITAFNFNGLTPVITGTITGTDIALTVPHGTNVTSLIPTITTTGASVSPNTGIAQNFTNPVTYTVTAGDNSTQAYTVTVIVASSTSTSTLPVVATHPVIDITQGTATGGGTIISTGGNAVSVSGIVWSTQNNPIYEGNGPSSSSTGGQTTDGWKTSGPWIDGITALTPNTTYYVRAYAVNGVGTAYGDNISFTTTPTPTPTQTSTNTHPRISPGWSSLEINSTLQYTATNFSGTVIWQVNGITGGNSTIGTISSTGLYTAPAKVPTPDTVEIIASTKTASMGEYLQVLSATNPSSQKAAATAANNQNTMLVIALGIILLGACAYALYFMRKRKL